MSDSSGDEDGGSSSDARGDSRPMRHTRAMGGVLAALQSSQQAARPTTRPAAPPAVEARPMQMEGGPGNGLFGDTERVVINREATDRRAAARARRRSSNKRRPARYAPNRSGRGDASSGGGAPTTPDGRDPRSPPKVRRVEHPSAFGGGRSGSGSGGGGGGGGGSLASTRGAQDGGAAFAAAEGASEGAEGEWIAAKGTLLFKQAMTFMSDGGKHRRPDYAQHGILTKEDLAPGLPSKFLPADVVETRASFYRLLRMSGTDGEAIGVLGSLAHPFRGVPTGHRDAEGSPGRNALYSKHTLPAIEASLRAVCSSSVNIATMVAGGTTGVAQAAAEAVTALRLPLRVVQVLPRSSHPDHEGPPGRHVDPRYSNIVLFDPLRPHDLPAEDVAIRFEAGDGWDQRKYYLGSGLFLYLLFEGGYGAAMEMAYAYENGAYVLPIACTRGLAGDALDRTGASYVARPPIRMPRDLRDTRFEIMWRRVCDTAQCVQMLSDGTLEHNIAEIVFACYGGLEYREWRTRQENELFWAGRLPPTQDKLYEY